MCWRFLEILCPCRDPNLGITDGHKTTPADASLESAQGKSAWPRVAMEAGRERQIQEICCQLGLPVVRIVCIHIGLLRLGHLQPH
jgi:16S rRNA U516 pseudouridylate synthase RsuA-like enzyme